MTPTEEYFSRFTPDPHASPTTGAGSTVAYSLLSEAEKKIIAAFMQRCKNNTPLPGDAALLEKIARYLPSWARAMSDADLLKLVLDAIRPRNEGTNVKG